jgi:hypothetical protein
MSDYPVPSELQTSWLCSHQMLLGKPALSDRLHRLSAAYDLLCNIAARARGELPAPTSVEPAPPSSESKAQMD